MLLIRERVGLQARHACRHATRLAARSCATSRPQPVLPVATAAAGAALGLSLQPVPSDLLPHRRAAARRVAAAAALAEEVAGPTSVPRNVGVTDGPWDQQDQRMVKEAIEDANRAVAAVASADIAGYTLLGKSEEELKSLAAHYKQPSYRAKQLLEGVLKGARSISEILTVPAEWRAQLTADGVLTGRSIMHHSVAAPDGTRKFLLQLSDGRVVETVGIPNDEDAGGDEAPAQQNSSRASSSSGSGSGSRGRGGSGGAAGSRQESSRYVAPPLSASLAILKVRHMDSCVRVGCPMRCSFCATGKGGFARNLKPHEIVDQVLTVQEAFGKRVTNVVFMGMGEPLLNLPSAVSAYKLMNQQLGIGGRYITISTVGVPNAIAQLAKSDVKSTLAVSIHAPTQEIRQQIIPSAKAYPLTALMKDCTEYYKITGRRVTFEYCLLGGINDKTLHAKQLAQLLLSHNLMSHCNIIPWNPVDESEFERPSRNQVYRFVQELDAHGLTATIRSTRGLEAAAACGQLRNSFQKTPMPASQQVVSR